LGRRIGSGKFGDVYLSIHRASGFLCAIKKILKSTIREYGMEGQLGVELRLHYAVWHPHVVQLYGHFDDEYHIFLLMEYACDGALIDHLRVPEPQAATAVAQVVRAVEALHRRRIVHRDIKP
jgi:aurora kinase, other